MIEAIYEPRGLAREYSPLACNLYRGCSHGCSYCYCPGVLRMKREEFFVPGVPRKGILEALVRDAQRLAGDPRPVLLSFTSDPYQPCEEVYALTQKAIRILAKNNLKIRVLTKNPVLAVKRDLALLVEAKVHLGTTLATQECEPGAPPSMARIDALREARASGVSTWVSFEPVIVPEYTLNFLQQAHEFADVVKIGRWNYDKAANEIDWFDFLKRAMFIIHHTNLKYYIKNDLWALASPEFRAENQQSNLGE